MAGSQKIVLITGANRGIGLEAAKQLAARGCHVIIGARDSASGKKAAEGIVKTGGKSDFLHLDVSNSESVKSASREFTKIADRLDVLINNAGIYPDRDIEILTASRDHFASTFQTNTIGALAVTQAFLPMLRKSKAGRVINLSSGYGQLGGLSPQAPSYCLSKLALNGLTIMLANALKGDGIAVNSMCPGWVRTDMGGPNATRSVEQGADTAVWLTSDAAEGLTGKFFRDRKEIPW